MTGDWSAVEGDPPADLTIETLREAYRTASMPSGYVFDRATFDLLSAPPVVLARELGLVLPGDDGFEVPE